LKNRTDGSFKKDSESISVNHELQVLQEVAAQLEQLEEEDAVLSPPPPMPKREMSFCISRLPQLAQTTFFSPPMETSTSKHWLHPLQENSYIGMTKIL